MGFPAFEMQKRLFKRGLERNCKSKSVLEFDIGKDVGIVLEEKKCLKNNNLLRMFFFIEVDFK